MDEYVKVWSKEIFSTIGKKPDFSWRESGLEYYNCGIDMDGPYIICRVINKESFLWACIKHEFDYKSFNIYSSFVTKTKASYEL
jgi:hypothetical protein